MSKELIIAIAWALSLAVVGAWQRHDGKTAQKVEDQAQFDKINADIANQNAKANALYVATIEEKEKAKKERAAIKLALEKERQSNVQAINDLRTKYAGVSLRYSIQGSGLGSSDSCAMPGTGSAAGNSSAEEYELPAAITNDLRELAYQCDALNADYKLLWEWANGKH